MNPWLPLIAGFMLRLDDGSRVWIQCRYERIHKVCTKCGMIGHTRTQCTYLMADVEQLLHRQRQRIQDEFHVQYGFDPLEPHFVNELRAFYNRPQRWSTQIRFGPLSRDTGYWHRQHQQGGPPPPQPTMQSFMEAVQNDMHEVPQEPPLTPHAVHNHNVEPTPPTHSPTVDTHNQTTTPPLQEHPQPILTQPLWQPPANSNLHWVWIDRDGPFLTNALLDQPLVTDNLHGLNFEITFETNGLANETTEQCTTLVAQLEVHVDTEPNPDDSLEQRMNNAGFNFEAGDSSRTTQAPHEEDALELHLTQFHLETTESLTWLNQTHITLPNQTILINPRTNNLAPKIHFDPPNSPGPPLQTCLTATSPLMQPNHNTWPISNNLGPMVHDHPNPPDTCPIHTPSSPLSPEHTLPIASPPKTPPTSLHPTTRKRIRKEFRLGQNIRQRLFCGLFQRELTGKQDSLDEDSVMGLEEASPPHIATSTPQVSTRNEGLWEADPNQLPQTP